MENPPDGLRLEVTDYAGLSRWRWVLTDGTGTPLAEHEVRLDPGCENFEAFTTLHDYVAWHAAPDMRTAEEARILTRLGDWIGAEVFGPAIADALLARRPAAVEVVLPPAAAALAYLPLEAARIAGRTLAGHNITLVICLAGPASVPVRPPPTGPLRVLGLFSLPEGGEALNLRRERAGLVELIRGIAAAGQAAEVKVLQYGVTRARLRDVLEDGDGWDVIHLSGHGTPGELVLETADGRPDRVPAEDLADLLDIARGRVRLVTVSACWSAARATSEPRRLLRLPDPEQDQKHESERIMVTAPASGDVATKLAELLGCAVLAMRFPVEDDFSIALTARLYDLLARQGQPLPRAVGLALRHLAEDVPGRWFPALSLAAPAIFGAAAMGLTLKAPPRTSPPSYAAEDLKMAGFPPQPDRFVGRTAVMTRASAALAAESGVPGVVLHGMPGGGKTAAALELAYTHEDAFAALVWFKAPDEGSDITGALMDFALTLERRLGFQMADKVVSDEKLAGFLPVLTELMKRGRLLLVIDNAESLLTDAGEWRDPQWAMVVTALTAHTGLGRVILTSRRVPSDAESLQADPVDALSADEALLLARELPSLRKLIYGEYSIIDRESASALLRRILAVAQGHPKLLELIDGQVPHPGRLAALGETTGDDDVQVLAAWTRAVTDFLSPGERDLFWLLCCLDEPDRIRMVTEPMWPRFWQRLGHEEPAPALGQTLTTLAGCGLVTIYADTNWFRETYAVHPGVAAAGCDHAGPGFQATVDEAASSYWTQVFELAAGDSDNGSETTTLMVRAGLSAVPYCLRRGDWDQAHALLYLAFFEEQSRANAAAMLPAARRIADHDPRHADTLSMILRVLDPAAAEVRTRAERDLVSAHGDDGDPSPSAWRLIELYQQTGRLAEALALADREIAVGERSGLSPWEQLRYQVQRLEILGAMGRAEEVFDEFRRVREHMDTLTPYGHERPTQGQTRFSRHVRERLLSAGLSAATELGRWQEAIDINADVIASQRARSAPRIQIAVSRSHDSVPLRHLGRLDDALDVLLECREACLDAGWVPGIGRTLGALAQVERERGHVDAAIRLFRDALRYAYLARDVTGIVTLYQNLGYDLRVHAGQHGEALVNDLAAALIYALTGADGTDSGTTSGAVRSAAADLSESGGTAEPPADVADLCRRLDGIPGTDLPGLIGRLSPDPETAERALQDLIARALAEAAT